MSTFNELRDQIIDDMDRGEADNSRVEAAINQAIATYQRRRFYFNEGRDVTFSCVAGQSNYEFGADIGTDFYTLDAVFVIDGSDNHELCERRPVELEHVLDGDATDGRPLSYARLNRTLRLWPSPDDTYTVRLIGHEKLAAPTGDTENAWTADAGELIRCRAKALLAAHVFPDPTMAMVMQSAEASELRSLMIETQSKLGTGRVVPTQF